MPYVKTPLYSELELKELITIHYFEYMNNFEFRGESHNFWEFMYVDHGTLQVCSDDQWATLNAGDIIFHRPNEFHAIKSVSKEPPSFAAMSFTTDSPAMDFFIKKGFSLLPEERELLSLILSEARKSLSTPIHVPSVEQVLFRPDAPFAAHQILRMYLEIFLISAIRNHNTDSDTLSFVQKEILPRKASQSERLENILSYMEFRICDRLTVEDICNTFSIGRSTLQSLFHKQLGCGAMDHFSQMKIDRAKTLIRTGSMTITEIAYFLSFNSPSHLSHKFHTLTGMSPSEYASSIRGLTERLLSGQADPDADTHRPDVS